MLNRIVSSLKAYPLALLVGLVLFTAMIVVTLIPETFRLWNFTLFGAVGIYVAARGGRYGLLLAIVLMLSAKFAADFVNYQTHGQDADYLPAIVKIADALTTSETVGMASLYQKIRFDLLNLIVYASLVLYAVLGWRMLRKGVTLPRILGTALIASIQFFLLTNFVSWLVMALPYDRSVMGLLQSYWAAVPFYRGTLLSDLTFTPLLFGLEYVLLVAPWTMAQRAEQPIQ